MKIKNSKIRKVIIEILFIIIAIILFLSIIYNMIYVIRKATNLNKHVSFLGMLASVVEDDSMKPNFKKYDLVFIKENNQDIKEEDVIAFYKNDVLNISRVKMVKTDGNNIEYVTKGDNGFYYNLEPIKLDNVKGKVNFRLPIIGLIILMSQSKVFTVITGILVVILLIKIVRQREKSLIRKEKVNRYKDEYNKKSN